MKKTLRSCYIIWIYTFLYLYSYTLQAQIYSDHLTYLSPNEFNRNAFNKNKEGEMLFGGVNGISAFRPKELKKNIYQPSEAISQDNMLNLSYKDVLVSFEFAALSFFNAHKNKQAYKLESLHNDWIQLGHHSEITFTNLTARNYTLRIKACNNDGVWNEQGIVLKINITPPVWATWWFRTLAAFIVIGCIVVVYTVRINIIKRQKRLLAQKEVDRTARPKLQTVELEELNKTKDQLFAIIAHDLRSPVIAFQEISKLIDFFLKTKCPEKIKELGEMINESAKGLNNLLDNLLNWALIQKKSMVYHPQTIAVDRGMYHSM